MRTRLALIILLAAVTAYAGGQIGVTGYPAVPRTLKGGIGINIKPDGTFEATGEAVSIGAQPFENLSTALRGKFLPISGTAADANAYKGASSPSATEFNYLQGVTSDIQTQLNGKIGSIRFSSYSSNRQAEYTTQQSVIAGKLDSATAATTYKSQSAFNSFSTATQGKFDAVYDTLQPEIDAKQSVITGAATTIASTNLTASRAVVSNSSGKVAVSTVTSAELGYLSGVTSSVQTQLNGKLSTSTAFNGDVSGTASNLQVLDDSHAHTSATLPLNNSTQAGIVATGAGQVNKVWKTDSSGIPQWRDDATGGSPSFDTLTGGTNTASTFVIGTGSSLTYAGTGAVDASRYKGEFAPTAEEFSYLSGVTSGIQEQINGLDDATQAALDGKASTSHASTHATGNSDALTPGDIGAATAAQGAKADSYLMTPQSGTYFADNILAGRDMDPLALKSYIGSTTGYSTSPAPSLRFQRLVQLPADSGGVAGTSRATSFDLFTVLGSTHDRKYSNVFSELLDNSPGAGDHVGIHSLIGAGADRDLTRTNKSSGLDMWAYYGFTVNNGRVANGTGAEFGVRNTDTTTGNYYDTLDGTFPTHMMFGMQINPDGSTRHVTRGASITGAGNIGQDTGLYVEGAVSEGIRLKATIPWFDPPTNSITAHPTAIQIVAGSGSGAGAKRFWTGIDPSAETFTGTSITVGNGSGPAYVIAPNQTFSNGTIDRKLSDLQQSLTQVGGIEVNSTATGDRTTYFDLHSDDTNTDYSTRISRSGGVNGQLNILNAGTGAINFGTSPVIVGGHLSVEGVSSTGATGTGNIVFGTSPTLAGPTVTGTLAAASITASGTISTTGVGAISSGSGGFSTTGGVVAGGSGIVTTGRVGAGTASPQAMVHASVGGGGTPTEVARFETIGNAGATRGPRATFYGQNAGSSQLVATIDGLSPSATNGALEISTVDSGTNTKHVRVDSTGVAVTGAMAATGAVSGASASFTGNAAAKTFSATIPAATTYGTTSTVDLSAGQWPSLTLTGNTTLAFSNPQVGSSYGFVMKQNGTGGYTAAWPSTGMVCTFIKSDYTTTTTGPTMPTAANAALTVLIVPTSSTTANCWAAGY